MSYPTFFALHQTVKLDAQYFVSYSCNYSTSDYCISCTCFLFILDNLQVFDAIEDPTGALQMIR